MKSITDSITFQNMWIWKLKDKICGFENWKNKTDSITFQKEYMYFKKNRKINVRAFMFYQGTK
jgi:hypothetical protein